jgi:UDPglucose 6-dehydrogenase
MEAAKSMLHDVTYATDAYDCAEGADALVLITEWDAYRALDLERLKQRMRARVVVDLRNVYRDEEMARHGFDYVRVGAKPGVTEPSAAAY